ncbi:MAG TPA: CHASE3 domain-containing protein [Methylomirabilota bacterium]|nr:CHASE3 domain-containing protein [Methylomirabilota bacterium]
MPWSLTRGQTAAMALLVAALLVDAVLTLHNIREVATAVQWVSHTHEVLDHLERVVSTLKDAETGQRGYLLTGERVYLEPYEQALARIPGRFEQLRQLTIDNPPQTAHVLKLEQLAAERLAVLRQGIERFQAEPDKSRALALSRQYLLQGEGKRLMDLVRDEVFGMQQLERALLARRETASRANTRAALASTVVGLGLGLALVAMVIALVARNLAARQRAADVVHAERERFRTTLSSIGDAVVVTDAQGRVTLLNPVAQALTGWGGEALGEPLDAVFRIVNEATRETVENPVSKVIRLGTIVGLANHTVLIAKDGAELPIDDSGAPIRDAHGRIVGVVLVFRDITARRGSERGLEDADRRKDEFLAMLAHELRNPLAPIRNAAHTLALLGTGDDRVRWVASVIERQVGLMTRLVDDLLDVSRITSGKITLQRATVSVAAVLAQAVEAARPPAESRRQTLEVDVPEDVGWVDGDPARLAQVVGNLLDNAIKYTEDGGRVRLRARAEADEIVIVVEDSGVGIDPALLPHVFDLFIQADRSLERKQGGLGLGLTLVRRLVEMHGGRVEAASAGPGLGSAFTIRLPRLAVAGATEPAPAADPAETVAAAGPARRILVVDDHQDSTDSLALFLRLRGHEVRTAHDGPSALDEIERYRPDVVFLDLGLPGMSGYDVARRVRKMDELGPLRLVALTGYGTDGDRQKTREAGFDVHLAKPVDPRALDALLAD